MNAKKRFLFIGAAVALQLLITSQINAQRFELAPFVGYQTGAKTYTTSGDLHINDGMNYGGSLDVGMGGGRYAEFSYSHLSSQLYLEGSTDTKLSDLAVDYYSLALLQEIRPDAKASPYGLLGLGLVNYRPTSGDLSGENKMQINIAGGIKIRATGRIGLRLQARCILPMFYSGTYFTAGTGGTGYGMSGGITAVQGDFTAALVFMLGN